MKPPTAILAATDLSAPSRHAAERACQLAAQMGARLNLLHVLQQGALAQMQQLIGPAAEVYAQQIAAEAARALDSLAADCVRKHGIVVESEVLEGAVVNSICTQAAALAADLLVVGARGEGFLRHMLLGSSASRLLRKTLLPVLVVKQSPHEAYRRLLVTVDFSPLSALALAQARAIAPQAQLVLLHAFEVPFEGKLMFAGVEEAEIYRYRISAKQEAMRKLHEFAAAAGLAADAATLLVQHGDATQQIIRQEQEQDCDLIVLGKHGDLLEDYLLGSVTKHVLAESQGDVLVVSAGEAD